MPASSEKPQLYERILFTEEEVSARIEAMAAEVINRYLPEDTTSNKPLFVCLLRGGAPFSMRLMSAIARQAPHFHPELDYMTVRTYGDGRNAKQPELVMDLSPHTEVAGRPIVVLDDLLDTGRTAGFVTDSLRERGAGPIELCVLVQKDKANREQTFDGVIHYGFVTPDVWLTGMGMNDTREALGHEGNRWAGYIAVAVSEQAAMPAPAS
jgi:hypoxanthine phosphoribosyltransferase